MKMGKGLQKVLRRKIINKQVERCWASLVIVGIRIKITLVCHPLTTRLGKKIFFNAKC